MSLFQGFRIHPLSLNPGPIAIGASGVGIGQDSIRGTIIDGHAINIHADCCCCPCGILGEYGADYWIRNIEAITPFGAVSFQDLFPQGYCREAPGGVTDCDSSISVLCGGSNNNVNSVQLVLFGLAAQTFCQPCDCLGVPQRCVGVCDNPLHCLTIDEFIMAGLAIFNGYVTFPNIRRGPCTKCRILDAKGWAYGAPGTPWEGELVTFKVTEIYDPDGECS
jgi:hypothetical protein